jgi:hypothetical protein
MKDAGLVVLPEAGSFPRVTLVEPSGHGYLLLALEVDRRPGLLYRFESRRKRALAAKVKALAGALSGRAGVVEATAFKALIIPPGRGRAFATDVPIPLARYDLVLLVTLESPTAAEALAADAAFRTATGDFSAESRSHLLVVATNARRIAPVDHTRDGVFLFNFFAAASRAQNLAVWEYTAGWFQDQTGLDNSTLLLPEDESVPYSVINHCRWDRLGEVVPALLFKRSFRSYVLKHFAANRTTAMPILYRLA